MITAQRYHDFSCGHRVVGHEGACANLHGHNYRVHFSVVPAGGLDKVGRVIDFSVIKSTLCQWLEDNWDHNFLMWEEDPYYHILRISLESGAGQTGSETTAEEMGIVEVPFNPTAENIAAYLVEVVGPQLLNEHECVLVHCKVEETRKCSATASLAPIMVQGDDDGE